MIRLTDQMTFKWEWEEDDVDKPGKTACGQEFHPGS